MLGIIVPGNSSCLINVKEGRKGGEGRKEGVGIKEGKMEGEQDRLI